MTYTSVVENMKIVPQQQKDRSGQSSEVSTICYIREVPLFVGPALERLYGNLYSSLPHFISEGRLQDASTYVVRKGGELITIFLFRIIKGRLEVLNEVIAIEEADINCFARYIFEKFKEVKIISFRSIETDISKLSFQFQRFNCLEDFVLRLPPNEEAYMDSLSASTRSVLRRKLKMISREFPSFTFKISERGDINVQDILDIIQFNKIRMANMNKVSNIADAATERIITLAKECGMIIIASIDGRVCGGVISCRVGANYFSLMVAHDPTYNAYSLGFLCNYRAICESIARNAKEFHFLWGRYRFKYTLLATPRELDYLAIYRSEAQFILNGNFAVKVLSNGMRRRLSLWLHELKQQQGLMPTLAVKILSLRKKLMGMRPSSLEN